jgi:ubiquinone/menaquinone biosynthesis C-methylase UbiE
MSSAAKTALTQDERAYYELNARVYPKFAPFYDLVASPASRVRRQVAELVSAAPGMRILDVATGTGSQAVAFARRGAEVVGVDLSAEMLDRARRKGRHLKTSFQQADATSLPLDDGTFDLASVSFALHEMPLSIREKVLSEMARVTRPGGNIVIVDYWLPRTPVWRWLVYHVVKLYEHDHYVDFVRSDVPALLRGAGIELTSDRSALLGVVRILVGPLIRSC